MKINKEARDVTDNDEIGDIQKKQSRIARGKHLDLTLHSVEPNDEGLYHCVVTRFSRQPTKSEHGAIIKLVVNAPPQITSPHKNHIVYGTEGSSLDVDCTAEGAPPPEVTWTRNDQIISTSNILHIDSMTKSDKGNYVCLAVNVEGKATVSIEVKFSKPASFDISPVNKTIIEGSNLLWHCHASSLPERITYNWYFDKKNVKTTAVGLRVTIRDGDLMLSNVQKSDRGWYSCEVTDSRGQASSASAFLDVLYPPEPSPLHPVLTTIGVGRNATLRCEVDSNPPPTLFTWSKNGHFAAASSSNNYTITRAKDSDSGIYGCQAENEIGKSAVIETHVVIAEPPIFAVKPPPEIRIREGYPLEVNCEGFGDPLPIVYWIHNQKRISSSLLSFQKVSHEDYGLYECVVSNSVETVSSKMNLIVEDTRPQPAVIESITCNGEDAFDISWSAGFDSSKTQTFVVHVSEKSSKDTRIITTSETQATIDDLEPFSLYRITVESRNVKGVTNSSIVEKQSCSTLEPPSKISIDYDDSLSWSAAYGAKSYRVEARDSETSEYRVLGETNEPYFHLSSDGAFPMSRSTEVRVRSLRPHYPPSTPSHFVRVPTEQESITTTTAWALTGGVVFFLLFIVIYLYCRYNKPCKSPKKIRRSPSVAREHDYVGEPSPHPITEIYYEPSLKLLGDRNGRGDGNPWEQRDEAEDSLGHLKAMNNRCPHKKIFPLVDFDFEAGEDSASAVDDMLRNKYIYEAEDVPAQLFADLRIERLRREFKQSQL
ncbi:hypothetical protein WR25_18940 [Diploscapter pachys]|uniref:Uncharacterized protein n=1 Tax=Diploscapter pachys TaxID=2018661 RepID=A0A2A2K8Z6_9BILA|nr:hypothetical protein WR25_18940 [Diploscapter pachys]